MPKPRSLTLGRIRLTFSLCNTKYKPMESNWATEHLQVIRTLMERAEIYRRALAPVMLLTGTAGLLEPVCVRGPGLGFVAARLGDALRMRDSRSWFFHAPRHETVRMGIHSRGLRDIWIGKPRLAAPSLRPWGDGLFLRAAAFGLWN